MKLIPLAIGIAVGAWVLSRTMRDSQRQPEGPKDTITRWEGEGGAIPEVQATQSTVPTNTAISA